MSTVNAAISNQIPNNPELLSVLNELNDANQIDTILVEHGVLADDQQILVRLMAPETSLNEIIEILQLELNVFDADVAKAYAERVYKENQVIYIHSKISVNQFLQNMYAHIPADLQNTLLDTARIKENLQALDVEEIDAA